MNATICRDRRCGMFDQVVEPVAHPKGGPANRCPVCFSTVVILLEADVPTTDEMSRERP